jgi:hypothetical protein
MDDALEHACRSRLKWKRDGADWVLLDRRRRLGRVVPDAVWPGMYRSVKSGGRLSDIANLSWSKDAVMAAAIRELEWTLRCKPARDLSKCPVNEGVNRLSSLSIRLNEGAATYAAQHLERAQSAANRGAQ